MNIGDYFTEDMANEWFTEDINILNELAENDKIGKKAPELCSLIDKNFIDVSLNGKLYKKEIWTLEALKNHIFWENQRTLAKQLIDELLKKAQTFKNE